jgi:hypothetical protein
MSNFSYSLMALLLAAVLVHGGLHAPLAETIRGLIGLW